MVPECKNTVEEVVGSVGSGGLFCIRKVYLQAGLLSPEVGYSQWVLSLQTQQGFKMSKHQIEKLENVRKMATT